MYIGKYRMLRVVDEFTLLLEQFNIFKISIVYKKKANKVQLVDLRISDSSRPRGVQN